MRYLSSAEYEALVRQSLVNLGLTAEQADAVASARWPMEASGLIAEAYGRGLIVALDDVEDWLVAQYGDTLPDGEPMSSDRVVVMPDAAEAFMEWAVETGRAKLTELGEKWNKNFAPIERKLRSAKWLDN